MAQPLISVGDSSRTAKIGSSPGTHTPSRMATLPVIAKKIPDGNERIFEVIQKSKTKDKVELSEGLNPGIFRIYNTELQVGGTASGFVHIFLPAIERKHIESKIAQKNSKWPSPQRHLRHTQLKVLLQGLE